MTTTKPRGEQWRRRQHHRAIEADANGHANLAKQIRADLWIDAHQEANTNKEEPE